MSDDGRQSAGHEYQSGLSLIELIITIVVLAISLVGITFVINNSLSRSSDTLVQAQAVALAQAYLDEILGKRFDDNTRPSGIPPCRASGPPPQQCTAEFAFGPDGGETRAQFDDVDDYHGLDEGVGQANPIQDQLGNTRSGYENFRVQVSVRYINIGVGEEEESLRVSNELDDQFDAKLITIAVFYPGVSNAFNLSAYKGNF